MIYYNDNDPKACAWLRELIAAGHLPAGHVDCRSITEITPNELDGYSQCHWFAGIGGWPLALRWAGWPIDREVWTGSCPCQPLSCSGKRQGHADERHLWPAFCRLIAERKPATIFGEQVASKDGREWFAGVRLDLEGLGYACGAADLCAAGFGAPHRRQRLFWVADSDSTRHAPIQRAGTSRVHCEGVNGGSQPGPKRGFAACRVADMQRTGLEGFSGDERDGREPGRDGAETLGYAAARGSAGELADASGIGAGGDSRTALGEKTRGRGARGANGMCGGDDAFPCGATGRVADAATPRLAGARQGQGVDGNGTDQDAHRIGRGGKPADGSGLGDTTGGGCGVGGDAAQPGRGGHADRAGWAEYDMLPCRDGKARRVEAGTFPLAHGIPGRMGLLRGYGNAIVPQAAAKFIEAFTELAEVAR